MAATVGDRTRSRTSFVASAKIPAPIARAEIADDHRKSAAASPAKLRAAIQAGEGTLRDLARDYGVNVKTVMKWRRRTTTDDLPRPSRRGRALTLRPHEEAAVAAFRRCTDLPLDSCTVALRHAIPAMNNSLVYRCLLRQGEGVTRVKTKVRPKTSKAKWEIGRFHVGLEAVHVAGDTTFLLYGFDKRTSFGHAQIWDRCCRPPILAYFASLIADAPYRLCRIEAESRVFRDANGRDRDLESSCSRLCALAGIELAVVDR